VGAAAEWCVGLRVVERLRGRSTRPRPRVVVGPRVALWPLVVVGPAVAVGVVPLGRTEHLAGDAGRHGGLAGEIDDRLVVHDQRATTTERSARSGCDREDGDPQDDLRGQPDRAGAVALVRDRRSAAGRHVERGREAEGGARFDLVPVDRQSQSLVERDGDVDHTAGDDLADVERPVDARQQRRGTAEVGLDEDVVAGQLRCHRGVARELRTDRYPRFVGVDVEGGRAGHRADVELVLECCLQPVWRVDGVVRRRGDAVDVGDDHVADAVRREQPTGAQGRPVGDEAERSLDRVVTGGARHREPVGEGERAGVDHRVRHARRVLAPGNREHPGVTDVQHPIVAGDGIDAEQRIEEGGERRLGCAPCAAADRDHARHQTDDDRCCAEHTERLSPAEAAVEHVGHEAADHRSGTEREPERDGRRQQRRTRQRHADVTAAGRDQQPTEREHQRRTASAPGEPPGARDRQRGDDGEVQRERQSGEAHAGRGERRHRCSRATGSSSRLRARRGRPRSSRATTGG
jgi:hypothetical protein